MGSWGHRIAALAAAAALVPACGGGGGGSGGPVNLNGSMAGVYHAVSLHNNAQLPVETATSKNGTVTFDGALTGTLTTTNNLNGTVTSNNPLSWTYWAHLDRAVDVTDSNGDDLGGGMVPSLDAGVFGTISTGSRPELWVILRKGGTVFPATPLLGDYFMVTFLFDPVAPAHVSETGLVTFDLAGDFSGTATQNAEGVVTPGSPVSGTYSVAADGTLSVVRAGVTYSGGVLADLSVATAASQTAGSAPGFVVFVRKGGTFTNATASGDYFIFGYEWLLAPTSLHESEAGAALLNGAGLLDFNYYDNQGGAVGLESGSATYSIAADGNMTLTTATEVFAGGLLDGGHLAVLGSTTSSSDPHVLFLVRH